MSYSMMKSMRMAFGVIIGLDFLEEVNMKIEFW